MKNCDVRRLITAAAVAIVLFVSQTGWATIINPLETGGLQGLDLLVKGSEREVELAASMCVGDFNGDGIPDIAVGSPRSSSPRGIVEAGTVSVFFGGASFTNLPQIFEAIADNKESSLLYGGSQHEYAGQSLACGDVNNDGIDDLVIGAQWVLDTGMPKTPETSKIYVVYGSQTLSENISLASASDVIIQRTQDSMHAANITVADVNNDGIHDILISDILTDSVTDPPVAPLVDGNKRGLNGAVYIIYGGNLSNTIDPSQDSDAMIVRNNGEGIFQVYGVAVGDFNGDGVNDMAFGAPEEDGVSVALSETGNVYLVMGGQVLPGNVNIEDAADTIITGAMVKDQIGSKLAAGDFNNDGIDDVIIGSPLSGWGEPGTTGKGKVQVVFGSSSMKSTIDLFDDSDVNLQLSAAAARIGFKTGMEIVAADMNADAVADLVVASPNASASAGTNGWVHVIFGGNSPKSNYDLDIDADISVIAPESDSQDPLSKGRMGQTMAAADLNNNGSNDLILGAPWGTGNNNYVGSGWFGVIFDPGVSTLGPVHILTAASPDVTVPAGANTSIYGTSGINEVTLKSGAQAELINFSGSNLITFESGAGVFMVSRSGTVVTFQGSDETALKVPATMDEQTIVFGDRTPMVLRIDGNQVKLSDQVIGTGTAAIAD